MLPQYEDAKRIFAQYELDLEPSLYEKLDVYASFLVAYNENVNLTALTAPRDILIKHFLDSILLLRHCELPLHATLLDVGSGAGFPSVPVLLMRSDLQLTLLDSLQKRIVFLQKLSETLGFTARFVHARAEDGAKMLCYREQFDVVTARAVAGLPTLCEYCMPFVKVGGSFFAMKGPSEQLSDAERAIQILSGRCECNVAYMLEGEKRQIFCIKKISQTSPKYPRNSGQIKSKAL